MRVLVRRGDGFIHLDHLVRLAVQQQMSLVEQQGAVAVFLDVHDIVRDKKDRFARLSEAL